MTTSVRNALYGILILFCVAFAGFIFLNGKNKSTLPELKERRGVLAAAPDWALTQQTVTKLLVDLRAKPEDAKLQLQLAKVYMQEGRVTGDYTYYNESALTLINAVLAADPKNFDALCLKSMVLMSQHRFAEGKALAMQGMQMNPYNSFIYGLLVDANVELGDYPEAVNMADRMVGIRPDIRSYSRVSYLREIHGDVPGALQAIQMAVSAGLPGNEDTEWARMVMGHLYEDSNQPELAEKIYQASLEARPDYPFALAGLGRIARYRKNYPEAIQYYERARDVMADAGFFEELIDLYRLNNQPEKAAETARATVEAVETDNITANKNKDAGHYADLELANLYLKNNQLDKALQHARVEQQRRPQNIDACQILAWVLYKQGQAADAAPFVPTMLRTKSQNPELLVKSGLILSAAGQQTEGADLIRQGLALKPYMDETLVAEAQTRIKG